MINKIQELLCQLGICDENSIVPFHPHVRERDDISVMKCQKSGVIFLSREDHIDIEYYKKQKGFSYFWAENRKEVLLSQLEDNHRGAKQFADIVCNKKWLDMGTGVGGILDLLSPIASETVAVEPQKEVRDELMKLGYNVYPTIEDVTDNDFDIITLFHVLEHLIEPLKMLKDLLEKLNKEGQIVIEVPHANDFLISFLALDTFKEFTVSCEHLILHTRESLKVFLQEAGFKNIIIQGCQRYPLVNHLYWLSKGKPRGHLEWNYLRTPELDRAYAQMLTGIDRTDTLIAIAQKE